MFNLAPQTFIFSKEFTCVVFILLSMSISSRTEFGTSPKHWESEDSDSLSNSLDVSWLLRDLGGFLSFFFSSVLHSNSDDTIPGKYVFLPIPKDGQICFGLKWNSQTLTFFVLLKLSAPPVRQYLSVTCNHFLRNGGSFGNLKSAIPVFTLFAS